MTSMAQGFGRDGEWGGWHVRPSKRGWICSQWSMVQGSTSGLVVLMPYSKDYPRGTDLSVAINDYGVTAAEAIRENYTPICIIRKGHVVQ